MEVVKDLTCPICLEFYCHPVILPCSHVMCKQPCADQLFDGNFIRCPVCRDNCYVSGGLPSLPRVITIESIIEKVRAERKERKKRNATNQGHARENSFDDLFSDVASDSKGNDRTSVSSPASVLPICNSPGFPEEENSPVSFPMREFTDLSQNTSSITNHFSNRTIFPNPETATTSSSPQILSTRNFSEDTVCESPSVGHTISLRRRRRRRGEPSIENTPSNTNPSLNHELPRFSNLFTHELISLPLSNTLSHLTTNVTPCIPGDSSLNDIPTDNAVLLSESSTSSERTLNLLSERFSTGENSLSRQRSQVNSNFVTSANPIVGAIGQGSVGASNSDYSFMADQVQTSTPRIDLRNIRLCHEQSLANLKACSDSIKALQQSRPAFKNSHNNSMYSPRIETNMRVDPLNMSDFERDETLVSTANQNQSHSGQLANSLLSTNQNSSSQGHVANMLSSSNQNPSNFGTNLSFYGVSNNTEATVESGLDTPQCELTEMPASLQGTHGDENESVSIVKLSIQAHLQKLCDIQNQLLFHMNSFTEKAQTGQDQFDKGRSDINKECDSLVAEIENKRYHFLLHIDDERKRHRLETDDATVAMQKLLASSQELSLFVEEMLESRPQTILSTAESLLDSLSSAVAECQTCLQTSEATTEDTVTDECRHLIDTRLQRSFVERIEYLSVPQRPVIDVHRCTRNTTTVALVLEPPTPGDVVDHYEISYCSDEQTTLGIQERYYAQMPQDPDVYGFQRDSFPVILIDNLCQSTHYFFCACAVNKKGKSASSDYVQCKTLAERDCVVPVPSVIENQYQITSVSVTMTCPSLATVTSHQCVHHCLLQKSNGGAVVWKGTELKCKKEEFTIRRLRPETHYNFVVIAFNDRGECQISSIVGLCTNPIATVSLQ